jgi:hypothetical protein
MLQPKPAWFLVAVIGCAAAQPKGAGRTVFIDAVPEAAGVETRLAQLLRLDGYRVIRGAEGADVVMRLDQHGPIDWFLRTGAQGSYHLEVVRGPVPGRKFTSYDEACAHMPGTLVECHADVLLRGLQEAGVLK